MTDDGVHTHPAAAPDARGPRITRDTSPREDVDGDGVRGDASRSGGVNVRLAGVRRQFGDVVALDDLDLELAAGELVALLGPSGCGKTTALRILAGFERPDRGEVFLDEEPITRLPPNKRHMGMVFQAYSLFPNLNLRDNVAFGLRMQGVVRAQRRQRAGELLLLVGLGDAAERYPHQLSGGQQQRVALARALAVQPRVLLLDEPLSALDARVRAQLRVEIRRIQLELGITTLFVTHDQSEALSIADRVGVMRAGRIEQLAPPRAVYSAPATPFVAEFVGSLVRLPAQLERDCSVVVLGARAQTLNPNELAGGARVDVLLRPEALDATPDPAGTGQVIESSFHGSSTRLRVAAPEGELLIDVPSHRGGFETGARVRVALASERVLVAPPREPQARASVQAAASVEEDVVA